MQLPDHPLRIREAARVELPRAVSELPRVVYHEHARRQAVVEHRLRVGEDVLLVLVVRELDPGVVLRRGEVEHVRLPACRREILTRREAERLRERTARVLGKDDLAAVGDKGDFPFRDRRLYRLGAPDDAAFVGQEKRRGGVGVVAYTQIALEVGRRVERHAPSESRGESPPALARQHWNRPLGGEGARKSDDGTREKHRAYERTNAEMNFHTPILYTFLRKRRHP